MSDLRFPGSDGISLAIVRTTLADRLVVLFIRALDRVVINAAVSDFSRDEEHEECRN